MSTDYTPVEESAWVHALESEFAKSMANPSKITSTHLIDWDKHMFEFCKLAEIEELALTIFGLGGTYRFSSATFKLRVVGLVNMLTCLSATMSKHCTQIFPIPEGALNATSGLSNVSNSLRKLLDSGHLENLDSSNMGQQAKLVPILFRALQLVHENLEFASDCILVLSLLSDQARRDLLPGRQVSMAPDDMEKLRKGDALSASAKRLLTGGRSHVPTDEMKQHQQGDKESSGMAKLSLDLADHRWRYHRTTLYGCAALLRSMSNNTDGLLNSELAKMMWVDAIPPIALTADELYQVEETELLWQDLKRPDRVIYIERPAYKEMLMHGQRNTAKLQELVVAIDKICNEGL